MTGGCFQCCAANVGKSEVELAGGEESYPVSAGPESPRQVTFGGVDSREPDSASDAGRSEGGTASFWGSWSPGSWHSEGVHSVPVGQQLEEYPNAEKEHTIEGKIELGDGLRYIGQYVKVKTEVAQGPGKSTHPDGSSYNGQWLSNRRHGFGKETFADGTWYEGQFVRGMKTGEGKFRWSDGSTYDGHVEDNSMHGAGTYTFTDGTLYRGQWQDGMRHGEGELRWTDGRVYSGQFKFDRKTGEGAFSWPNGRAYSGQFVNGRKHGFGTYTPGPDEKIKSQRRGKWKNGVRQRWIDGEDPGESLQKERRALTPKVRPVEEVPEVKFNLKGAYKKTLDFGDGHVYVGSVIRAHRTYPHGNGTCHHPDGTLYKGQWRNNKQHGKGKEEWPDGSSYDGDFQDGEKSGQGTYEWPDGRKYKGDVRKGQQTGEGALQHADGRTYKGQWRNCQMHGKGVFTWPDGRRYAGEYEDDIKSGQGLFTWPNGSHYEGQWQHGKQHGLGTYRSSRQEKPWTGQWMQGVRITVQVEGGAPPSRPSGPEPIKET